MPYWFRLDIQVICTNSLFEMRSYQYSVITSGYWILVFTLMELVLGAWQLDLKYCY